MSRLRITHRTHYRYGRPVALGQHRLVLRPREGHDLNVLSMQLKVEPAHQLIWSRDVFGNSVALVRFVEPAEQLRFESTVVLDRTAPFPTRAPHQPFYVPYPVVYDSLEVPIAGVYQGLSFPNTTGALTEWLEKQLPTRDSNDAEGILLALCERVHDAIDYQQRSERGVQDPEDTLTRATGSCRDMATLMMDCARVLGIASRFASGYLHCAASIAGRASTHAWMEAYLPALGWRGFDPTLGEPTSLKHIPVGVSNHPRGVMPISGTYQGSAADYKGMTVEVETMEVVDDAEKGAALSEAGGPR
ncbi:MAG TPA: transglutaminase family protein [Polyangiales bacterium]|nr:transglutaminase family protein [Polyangiales bacterium]